MRQGEIWTDYSPTRLAPRCTTRPQGDGATYAFPLARDRHRMDQTSDGSARVCAKCWRSLPADAPARRRFCSEACASTARSRRLRKQAIADAPPDVDSLHAQLDAARHALGVISAQKARLEGRLNDAGLERRRLAYAVEAALDRSEDRIGDHAEAIRRVAAEAADTTDQLDDALQQLATTQSALKAMAAERDRLSAELAGRVTADRTPATTPAPAAGRSPVAAAPGRPPAMTVATQVYRSLAALTSDLRDRKGELLEDADYDLIKHIGKYRDRLATNTTECDWRTIYYFNKITTSEFAYAKRQGTRPSNVVRAVELRNALIPLMTQGFPTRLPRDGQTVTMPATLTQEPRP